jgi:hypothetical protein
VPEGVPSDVPCDADLSRCWTNNGSHEALPTLPLRSYHASVLHKFPFCSGVVRPSTWSTIAGTIQAQIVAPTTQKCATNVGEDGEIIASCGDVLTVEKGEHEREGN